MKHLARVLCTLTLTALMAAPAGAQEQEDADWSHKWYWGAHVGVYGYATNLLGTVWDPMIGGHWFITVKRIALYAGIEQSFFLEDANALVGGSVVTFNQVRRINLGLAAMPYRGRLEPFMAGGFGLMYVVNPECGTCTADEAAAVHDLGSTGYAWGALGGQFNLGELSVFAQYMVTDAGASYIEGATHALQGGIRYSFGSARRSFDWRN